MTETQCPSKPDRLQAAQLDKDLCWTDRAVREMGIRGFWEMWTWAKVTPLPAERRDFFNRRISEKTF